MSDFYSCRWRIIGWAALLVVLVVAGQQAWLRSSGNLHAVIAGELYRSAQPSATDVKDYVARFGIRTIVNLRGAHPQQPWYRAERAAATASGARLIDFAMSASDDLSPARASELVAVFKAAQKPILIHCQAGSDRTGLASVIYQSQIARIDDEQAEGQLSLLYGHFGVPLLSPTYAMDRSWEALEVAFGIEGS